MTHLTAIDAGRNTRARRALAVTAALLGIVIWLECIALGIPRLGPHFDSFHGIIPAALIGAAIGVTRARSVLLGLCVALGVVLAVIAYTPVVRGPIRSLIRSDSLPREPLDAVVVLSGRVSRDGHLHTHALDRLLTGLTLVRRGTTSTLMLSRVRASGAHDVTSDADQRRVIALLERSVRVLLVDSVYSTRDEAVRMWQLAQPLGIRRVAVVTSPLHTHRACVTFAKVGFIVTCTPSESRSVALRSFHHPSDRVRAFQDWLYEMAGLAKYRANGWM